jgi:hypothetical protein
MLLQPAKRERHKTKCGWFETFKSQHLPQTFRTFHWQN